MSRAARLSLTEDSDPGVGSSLFVDLRCSLISEQDSQQRSNSTEPRESAERARKRWLSAGPRRHGLPERTLKRCHFGAANGWSKLCDEVGGPSPNVRCI